MHPKKQNFMSECRTKSIHPLMIITHTIIIVDSEIMNMKMYLAREDLELCAVYDTKLIRRNMQ